MAKKQYSIKELSVILGCSTTAVSKKISTDENNPSIKRYRKRFNVVTEDGQMYILLDEHELEEEKRRSKGFKNVSSNSSECLNNVENDDIIDVEPINKENVNNSLLTFTERYIENLSTFQNEITMLHKTYCEQLIEKDKKLNLLTVSEEYKQKEFLTVQSLNKTLQIKNNRLKIGLIILSTLLVVLIITFIFTFIFVLTGIITFNKNVQTTLENPQQIEEQLQVLIPEYLSNR